MKLSKHTAAILLSVLLLAAPVRAASGAAFADVPENHWARESIRRASEYGLVGGVGGNAFGLGQQVTRAQYAAMLCRLMGWTMVLPDAGSFTDNQDKSTWYYSAIETAYANGALLKLGDNCLPGEALRREEMAAMTVRALGCAPLAGLVQDDCPFTDVSTNRGYITMAYHMGFMGGVGAQAFSPRTASTREQAAAVLLRVYDRMHAHVATGALPADAGNAGFRAEPIIGGQAPVPISPRAPLENVYAAAVKAGDGGTVTIVTSPSLQLMRGGAVQNSDKPLTAADLQALLDDPATQKFHSSRYWSSYLLHPEKGGATTVVWYESDEDIAEKVQLCRILGVKTVYFE